MTSDPDSSSAAPRPLDDDALVSVLVAAYDEEATIARVLEQVGALGLNAELIVVDDGSSDRTPEILRRLEQTGEIPGLRVITHPANRGKGAAIRTAIDASRGDVVVIHDADGEYHPRDLPRVLGPILDGHADAVYGTRLRGGQPQRAHLFWHYAGNRSLSLLTNVLYNTTISDMEVGHKAFRGELIRSPQVRGLQLRARGDGQGAAPTRAALRGAGLILRAHLRGGQEDHLARRRGRGMDAAALPPWALVGTYALGSGPRPADTAVLRT